jgi:hypothetical protein
VFAHRFQVAVPAGHAEHAAGPKHPGSLDQAAFDRDGNAGIEAACVAHRREAAAQHGFEDELGLDGDPGRLPAHHRGEVHRGDRRMHMRIDQAGHQSPALGIDDRNVGAGGDRATVFGDFRDHVLFDPDRRPRAQLRGFGVQELGVLDDEAGHRLLLDARTLRGGAVESNNPITDVAS